MKRHDALIPLSHDHQHALARALRLRRAGGLGPDARRAAAATFLEYAEAQLRPHFVQEELLVERAVALSDSRELHDRRDQLVREHVELTRTLERLGEAVASSAAPSASMLVETGQQVTDHIRFEERQLFEVLQRELGDELSVLVVDAGADRG